MAFFGYSEQRESDCERAVRAALELIDQLPSLRGTSRRQTRPPLSARIGINTGLVIIGPETASAGHMSQNAVGEAVNIAARLQAEAPPNAVVVSEETLALIEGLFDTEPLGPRPIKGLSRQIAVHRVLRVRPTGARTRSARGRGAARMVGRAAALDALRARWTALRDRPQCTAVFVEGEAGIGKTRLVAEFCAGLN